MSCGCGSISCRLLSCENYISEQIVHTNKSRVHVNCDCLFGIQCFCLLACIKFISAGNKCVNMQWCRYFLAKVSLVVMYLPTVFLCYFPTENSWSWKTPRNWQRTWSGLPPTTSRWRPRTVGWLADWSSRCRQTVHSSSSMLPPSCLLVFSHMHSCQNVSISLAPHNKLCRCSLRHDTRFLPDILCNALSFPQKMWKLHLFLLAVMLCDICSPVVFCTGAKMFLIIELCCCFTGKIAAS